MHKGDPRDNLVLQPTAVIYATTSHHLLQFVHVVVFVRNHSISGRYNHSHYCFEQCETEDDYGPAQARLDDHNHIFESHRHN